jgi:hypothetical protein
MTSRGRFQTCSIAVEHALYDMRHGFETRLCEGAFGRGGVGVGLAHDTY